MVSRRYIVRSGSPDPAEMGAQGIERALLGGDQDLKSRCLRYLRFAGPDIVGWNGGALVTQLATLAFVTCANCQPDYITIGARTAFEMVASKWARSHPDWFVEARDLIEKRKEDIRDAFGRAAAEQALRLLASAALPDVPEGPGEAERKRALLAHPQV